MTFLPFSFRAFAAKMIWKERGFEFEKAAYDGDTVWLFYDKGNREYLNAACRLFGVNTPEMNDRDEEVRKAAVLARDFVREQVEDRELFVLSKDLDKYGRPLVIIWLNEADFGDTSKSLNKALIEKGHAVPYMGEL